MKSIVRALFGLVFVSFLIPCQAADASPEVKIKFAHVIIQAKDIAASKDFYAKKLQIPVLKDWGSEGGFLLKGDVMVVRQARYDMMTFKKNDAAFFQRNEAERFLLYLESNDLEGAQKRLKESGVKFVHEIEETPWGQETFRVYDPDGHVVEIADQRLLDF